MVMMMLLRRANVDQATGFSGLAGEWSGASHRSVKGQIVKASKGTAVSLLQVFVGDQSKAKQSNPRPTIHAGKLAVLRVVVALDPVGPAAYLVSPSISGAPPHRRRDSSSQWWNAPTLPPWPYGLCLSAK
jgi:hypothetical protein